LTEKLSLVERKVRKEKEALREETALEAARLEKERNVSEGKTRALSEKLSLLVACCADLTRFSPNLEECRRQMESREQEMRTLVVNVEHLTENCNMASVERSSMKEKIAALNRSLPRTAQG